MILKLAISDDLRKRIAEDARAAFPKECCGLIEGTRNGDIARAISIHPTRNLAAAGDRFEIDPAVQIRLMRELRGTARTIIGCYHSHPNGRAEPSEHDLKSAADEDFLWLIASIGPEKDAELAAFAFRGGAFAPVRLARARRSTL